MPKRTDLKKILLVGSGPIVIGQACEFDYSGTQACKALQEEGIEVVLVNSNPATIMTDPEFSARTYIEPLHPDILTQIIERERPQALLPTLGGQTALNLAVSLHEQGILHRYAVELIGANYDVIKKAEDRELFKKNMMAIGLDVPRSQYVSSLSEAAQAVDFVKLPCVIRPSFTLGGTGAGMAYNHEEYEWMVAHALDQSLIHQVLVEESIYGWKEYELEVMRDGKDNVVIICSIENLDPMGIHTGDSITVAPAQTLTDKEYQAMRDGAIQIMRRIGVECGGSNIQFAVHPRTGRMQVIEMNPRVSRSSALASKATGFPIARFAAKLALGYTLDELPNDMTRKTPACFEPTIDYCVVKFPKWAFEKFPETNPTLTTQMKSIGETMAIGRTFKEALQKAIRSLETPLSGLGNGKGTLFLSPSATETQAPGESALTEKLSIPHPQRLFYVYQAIQRGLPLEDIYRLTSIDPWFLAQIQQLVHFEKTLQTSSPEGIPADLLRQAKQWGYSDIQLAAAFQTTARALRSHRKSQSLVPVYKSVDTCAGEFEAYTPYFYSTYETENEVPLHGSKKKVVILGSGPNRIGQGIEFDYCCVHAALALREMGYESVMVNNNPETVSTDYDISDLLFFEPITLEDVLNVADLLNPLGLLLQFGGQTPLKLARPLQAEGVPILGTQPEAIDVAEDRGKFKAIVEKLSLRQPTCDMAFTLSDAARIASQIGYPVLVRPSYVLGGRAMEIVYDQKGLEHIVHRAFEASENQAILIDKFLEDAIEIDVDAVRDGQGETKIAGILEHIEFAGVHSGDATMTLPPHSLSADVLQEIERITQRIADEIHVLGLVNLQLALRQDQLYILEVNPRASRTIPFISKAVGIPFAKVATKAILGVSLKEQGLMNGPHGRKTLPYNCIKQSVFPFNKLQGEDIILGPEMKSTGEVMGIDTNLGLALFKAQLAAGHRLPRRGKVFVSVKDSDKRDMVSLSVQLKAMGFEMCATAGTHEVLAKHGIPAQFVYKIKEGRPNPVDLIINREIELIINTPKGKGAKTDEAKIRQMAIQKQIPVLTTLQAAQAAILGMRALSEHPLSVLPLQEYYARKAGR